MLGCKSSNSVEPFEGHHFSPVANIKKKKLQKCIASGNSFLYQFLWTLNDISFPASSFTMRYLAERKGCG